MAKVNLTLLQDSIDKFTNEFYTKPIKIKIPKERLNEVDFFINMFSDKFSMAIHKHELKSMDMVRIRDTDSPQKCISEKIIDTLGKGVFGKVYKVSDTVAVKLISLTGEALPLYENALTQKQDLKDKMTQEYIIAKRAGELGVGPIVHKIHSCCSDTRGCYVVMTMELLQGCVPLYKVHNKLSSTDSDLLRKILTTKIKLLHDNNIYHNDIHAGNIMVRMTKGGALADAFILDYGLATMDMLNPRRSASKDNARIDRMTNEFGSNMKAYVVWRMMMEKVFEVTVV